MTIDAKIERMESVRVLFADLIDEISAKKYPISKEDAGRLDIMMRACRFTIDAEKSNSGKEYSLDMAKVCIGNYVPDHIVNYIFSMSVDTHNELAHEIARYRNMN